MAETRGGELRARVDRFNDVLDDVEGFFRDLHSYTSDISRIIDELRNQASDLFYKIPLK